MKKRFYQSGLSVLYHYTIGLVTILDVLAYALSLQKNKYTSSIDISIYLYPFFSLQNLYRQLSSCCKSKVGEIFYPSFFLPSCRLILAESQLQWALQTDRANLLTFCTRKENSSSNLASSTIFSCTTRVGVKKLHWSILNKSSFSDLLVQSHYFILGICVSYQLQYMLFVLSQLCSR